MTLQEMLAELTKRHTHIAINWEIDEWYISAGGYDTSYGKTLIEAIKNQFDKEEA